MRFELKVQSIWQQGPREKQEDSIFPEYGNAKESDRLFILCDGMGGHSAGEIASKTVCTAISESVLKNCMDSEGVFTDEILKTALNNAFDLLDKKDNGAEKKMGTTLAFLKLHTDGCTIAHIGDSRVYHIRPGKGVDDTKILFQTIDHSLVNDLIRIGELTPEEARHSKQKNVITRAMQPCMERRPKADIYHTHDIISGDYFMLCSDGILEQMEDDNIKYIFSDKGGDIDSKVDMLIKVTEHNHDNHSAILILITDVIDSIKVNASKIIQTKNEDFLVAQVDDEPAENSDNTNKKEFLNQNDIEPTQADDEQCCHNNDIIPSNSKMKEWGNLLYIIKYVAIGAAIVLSLLVFYVLYKQFFKIKNHNTDSNVTMTESSKPVDNPSETISTHNSGEAINSAELVSTNDNSANNNSSTSIAFLDVSAIIPTLANEYIPCSDSEVINVIQSNM